MSTRGTKGQFPFKKRESARAGVYSENGVNKFAQDAGGVVMGERHSINRSSSSDEELSIVIWNSGESGYRND